MTKLADKVVWITGASSGIGEMLAYGAAERGARIVLTSRRQAELERVRNACADPARVGVLPADLTAFDAKELAQKAAGFFGPVDVLVNNAGWSQRSLARDTDMAVYRRLMELDFFAPVALTQAVLPGMLASEHGGHVVMVGSVVSRFGAPLRSGYSAAKHALAGFTEAARTELWREQVKFTLVCPGFVKTQVSVNALDGHGGTHGRMDGGVEKGMDARACAEKIWRAVERDVEETLIGAQAKFVHLKRF
ncbi:MAG TPA: SDR family NAD(P)-dependent oxidoreductase, partial [Nevskiaceae bacterium]|nr:SDR family NAD(P)-dependent oxidoreductase [Nevskiaceae bacterium]